MKNRETKLFWAFASVNFATCGTGDYFNESCFSDIVLDAHGAEVRFRDQLNAPIRKLTCDLIKTYKTINDVSSVLLS